MQKAWNTGRICMEKAASEQFPAGRCIERQIWRNKDDDVIVYDFVGHGVWEVG